MVGRAAGVVDGFAHKITRTIRNHADTPQLTSIQIAHHLVVPHRNLLTISIVANAVLRDDGRNIWKSGAMGCVKGWLGVLPVG